MNLQIDDDYQIVSDSLNYILQEKKVVADASKGNVGKEYTVNVGYFGKIHTALQAYKELCIRNSDVSTITELMELIKKLDKKIEKFLEGN